MAYERQKRYLKKRYAQDESYRTAKLAKMRTYRNHKYSADAGFREHEKMKQRQRYAREAALTSLRFLFNPQKAVQGRGFEAKLLQFCRGFVKQHD